MESETEDPRSAPARLDREHADEGDTEADRQPEGHRDELQRGLKAGEVHLVVCLSGVGLGDERKQAAVRHTRRQLE